MDSEPYLALWTHQNRMLGFLVPKDLAKRRLKKRKEKHARKICPPKRRTMASEAEYRRSRSSLLNLLWQKFNRLASPGSNSQAPGGGAAGAAQSAAPLK